MTDPGKMAITLLLFLTGLILVGCESQSAKDDAVLDKMETTLQEAIASNEREKESLPNSVSDALMPGLDIGKAEGEEQASTEERFDISVNELPAEQFFMSLVEGTSINMAVHPDVSGTITLNLKDVTIPDVLHAVRDVYGFEFIDTPYGFQVLPARLQARIYKVNQLNVQRQGSSATLVSSGALSTGAVSNDRNNQDNSGNRRDTNVFGTEIETTQTETDFWGELHTSLVTMVGEGDGRSVVVNPQSGVVVVRALPTELRDVERFLKETQLITQRQVILEAKIIEVSLDNGSQTGINWARFFEHNGRTIQAANIGGGSVFNNESGMAGTQGAQASLNPNNPQFPDNTATTAFGGVFSLALNFDNFTAFIELLKTQGDVQVLSSPRVSTLNNQKAVIKIGRDEFFVTDISTQNVTSSTVATITPDVTLTPFFSGIALDVTPQISEEGYVTLHVHPSISEVVDQEKTVTVGSVTQTLPLALSTIRETDSIVRAKSGQIIVIGGLMQDSMENSSASAPVAGDIPVLGRLFKHTKQSRTKSELVILLKPIVVQHDEQWQGALRESADALEKLRNRNR